MIRYRAGSVYVSRMTMEEVLALTKFNQANLPNVGGLPEETITQAQALRKLGIPDYYAWMTAMSRRGYWFVAGTTSVGRAISNERLASAGYLDLSQAYESIQSVCIGRAVYRTVRTVR